MVEDICRSDTECSLPLLEERWKDVQEVRQVLKEVSRAHVCVHTTDLCIDVRIDACTAGVCIDVCTTDVCIDVGTTGVHNWRVQLVCV